MPNLNNGLVRGRLANLGFEEPQSRKGGNPGPLQQTQLLEARPERMSLEERAQERAKKKKKKNGEETGSPFARSDNGR